MSQLCWTSDKRGETPSFFLGAHSPAALGEDFSHLVVYHRRSVLLKALLTFSKVNGSQNKESTTFGRPLTPPFDKDALNSP